MAQDVVQQTALIAWRKLGCLFPEMDFGSWLKGIARREALTEQRKAARFRLVIEEILEAAFDDPTPAAVAPEREALEACLKQLDKQPAEIIRAHYFQGQKLTEIAQMKQMNSNTVRTILYRARLALGDCIRGRLALGTE